MLRKSLQAQDRHGAVDFPHSTANQIRRRRGIAAGVRRELEMKENIALETLGEGEVERAVGILIEQTPPRVGHDADDLNLRFRPVLCLQRILLRELDLLAERVAVRPEFLRQDFIDDRDRRGRLMHRFRHVEGAPAQQRQADGFEIIRAHAIPARGEGAAFRRGRGPRVRRRIGPAALDLFIERDEPERHR